MNDFFLMISLGWCYHQPSFCIHVVNGMVITPTTRGIYKCAYRFSSGWCYHQPILSIASDTGLLPTKRKIAKQKSASNDLETLFLIPVS